MQHGGLQGQAGAANPGWPLLRGGEPRPFSLPGSARVPESKRRAPGPWPLAQRAGAAPEPQQGAWGSVGLGHSLQFISSDASSQSMNWLQRLELPMQLPSRQRNSVAAQLVSARGKCQQWVRLGGRDPARAATPRPHSGGGRACTQTRRPAQLRTPGPALPALILSCLRAGASPAPTPCLAA